MISKRSILRWRNEKWGLGSNFLLTRCFWKDVYVHGSSFASSPPLRTLVCGVLQVYLYVCPYDCLSPRFFPSSLSLGALKAKLPAG